MSLTHAGSLEVAPGPNPRHAIAEPVPVPETGPMTCRRGAGQRSCCQGREIPTCDGALVPARIGQSDMFMCSKCNLTHDQVVVDGKTLYGAVL